MALRFSKALPLKAQKWAAESLSHVLYHQMLPRALRIVSVEYVWGLTLGFDVEWLTLTILLLPPSLERPQMAVMVTTF